MRLSALDAAFIGNVSVIGYRVRQGDTIDGAQGVVFQCPQCSIGKPPGEPDGVGFAGAHYVQVCFANPRNAPVAPAEFDPNPRWQMTGTSLNDLTLSPSVNLDVVNADGSPSSCKWHGHVTNGDAT